MWQVNGSVSTYLISYPTVFAFLKEWNYVNEFSVKKRSTFRTEILLTERHREIGDKVMEDQEISINKK